MVNKIMKTLTIGDTTYEIVDAIARNDIETLKKDGSDISEKVSALETKVEENSNEPYEFVSYTCNWGLSYTRGEVVDSVTLQWQLSRTPNSLVIYMKSGDGILEDTFEIPNPGKTGRYDISDLSITWDDNKIWELSASNEFGFGKSEEISIPFYNNIYIGSSTAPDDYNEDFLKTLMSWRENDDISKITSTVDEGKYLYYGFPTRIGTPSFSYNGIIGGFARVSTIPVTNHLGYTEDYNIYRSDNSGLGQIMIGVN